MEMAYRKRWEAEIVEMRRILAGLPLKEECKWGKPTYTVDGKNVVILQGFKGYFALGFFQGALLKDAKKLLVQLGQTQAGRVMKFTSAQEIAARAGDDQGLCARGDGDREGRVADGEEEDRRLSISEELKAKFRKEPQFKKAFDALTPGRQRGYLYHFASAKQPATRMLEIEKAMPAIFAGRGFLERPKG